jgi:signal transduction histidine kinase/ActR/RegA family two-component response regulator
MLPCPKRQTDARSMFKHLANFRLRTKFLLSLILVTAGLTCATLLLVRRAVQVQMQREVDQDTRNAILTFQVLQHERELALSHKADLLATLAYIRNGDPSTIQDSSEDPWWSDDCDLFVLADSSGKIVSLHTTIPGFSGSAAEEMLHRSLRRGAASGWWYSDNRLYQVVLQSISDGSSPKSSSMGVVVVGHEIESREANDLRRMSSSDVVFRYGDDVVVSTLAPIQEAEVAQQIKGRWSIPDEVQVDGERFWARSVDLTPGLQPAASLTILKSDKDTAALLASMNHLLLGLGLLAVFAGAALVFMISHTFTHPLARLAIGVRALERGDFAYPLEADGGDEVAQVTRAFDRMRNTLQRNETQRQELENQLRQAQKMEAMGQLAGGVAHDFNNLLTIIKGHSGLLSDRLPSTDPLRASSQQIDKAVNRAASLTRQLLAFSRMQVLQPKILDLNSLVSEMGKLLSRLIHEDIAFSFRPDEAIKRVRADAGQIEQVILNLTVNACDAMPKGGTLIIETHNATMDAERARTRPPLQPGEYVLLSVTDSGHGMDANTKARIFEPFFTTKEQGKGTGLGLATVYGVVKQSGGWIWVDSEPGKGTRFEIYLPAINEAVDSDRPQLVSAPASRRVETVLLVEDEEAVRELAAEFVKSAGYRVLTAKDGKEAFQLAKYSPEPIHALVTDVIMPNMRGPELATLLKARRHDLQVVYMSGYLDYDRTNGDFLEDGFFLQKPFTRDTLVSKIDEALKKRPTDQSPAASFPEVVVSEARA